MGEGETWAQEIHDERQRVKARITALEAVLGDLVDSIPDCSCHKAFKDIGGDDPHCARCYWFDEDDISAAQYLLHEDVSPSEE